MIDNCRVVEPKRTGDETIRHPISLLPEQPIKKPTLRGDHRLILINILNPHPPTLCLNNQLVTCPLRRVEARTRHGRIITNEEHPCLSHRCQLCTILKDLVRHPTFLIRRFDRNRSMERTRYEHGCTSGGSADSEPDGGNVVDCVLRVVTQCSLRTALRRSGRTILTVTQSSSRCHQGAIEPT